MDAFGFPARGDAERDGEYLSTTPEDVERFGTATLRLKANHLPSIERLGERIELDRPDRARSRAPTAAQIPSARRDAVRSAEIVRSGDYAGPPATAFRNRRRKAPP